MYIDDIPTYKILEEEEKEAETETEKYQKNSIVIVCYY